MPVVRPGSRIRTMSELYDRIELLLADPAKDRVRLEQTLTDGYAEALALEAEGRRLQSRLTELAKEAEVGDLEANARELSSVARHLDGTTVELARLRSVLAELRARAA